MEIALVLFYTLIFSTFIYCSNAFNSSTIGKTAWVGVFLIKVVAAVSYAMLMDMIPESRDTNRFINDSNIVFSSLFDNPKYYLELVFGRNDYVPEPVYLKEKYLDPMMFWYDQSNYLMVRINSIIRLFSFGNYTVHFVFFAFFSFIGTYNIYRFFEQRSDLDDWLIFICIILFPGTFFWTAGAHKEALVIFFSGLILNIISKVSFGEKNASKFLFLLVLIFLLGLLRVYVLAVLIPGIIAFYWSARSKVKPIYLYILTYSVLLVAIVIYDVSSVGNRVAEEMTIRQNYFMSAEGSTSFELEKISNSWTNIFIVIPQVLINPIIRPLLSDCDNSFCNIAAVESIFLTILILILLFKFKIRSFINNPTALLCLFYSGSIFIILGIIVNNGGALVRYRSVVIPFLLIGLLLSSQKNEPFLKK